jgi:uncharacterized protein YaiL (DUF2058 family)
MVWCVIFGAKMMGIDDLRSTSIYGSQAKSLTCTLNRRMMKMNLKMGRMKPQMKVPTRRRKRKKMLTKMRMSL